MTPAAAVVRAAPLLKLWTPRLLAQPPIPLPAPNLLAPPFIGALPGSSAVHAPLLKL